MQIVVNRSLNQQNLRSRYKNNRDCVDNNKKASNTDDTILKWIHNNIPPNPTTAAAAPTIQHSNNNNNNKIIHRKSASDRRVRFYGLRIRRLSICECVCVCVIASRRSDHICGAWPQHNNNNHQRILLSNQHSQRPLARSFVWMLAQETIPKTLART